MYILNLCNLSVDKNFLEDHEVKKRTDEKMKISNRTNCRCFELYMQKWSQLQGDGEGRTV